MEIESTMRVSKHALGTISVGGYDYPNTDLFLQHYWSAVMFLKAQTIGLWAVENVTGKALNVT